MSENDVRQLTSISKASTYEEIGEFWDTHSLADYWDQTYEVEIEVRIPHRHRVAIEAETYDQLSAEARHRGVMPETLINLWLAERLRTASAHRRSEHQETPQPVVATVERQLAEEDASYSAKP